MPRTVTGGGSGSPAPSVRAEVGPALERRGGDGDARACPAIGRERVARTGRSRRTPRPAGRPDRRGRRRCRRPTPRCRRWWRARRTGPRRRARRRAIAQDVAQRPGAEAAPGEAGQRHARRGLEPELGEPGDQRRRVVVVAPAELDRVADLAVADDAARGRRRPRPSSRGSRARSSGRARRTSARARRGSRCRSCSRGCRSARRRTGGPAG